MNKRILITGISRGLGHEIAKVFLNANYSVLGIVRKKSEPLERLIKQYGASLSVKEFDLENSSGLEQELKEFLPLSLPLSGYINNAAVAYDEILTNLDLQPLTRMFNINVFSPMMLTRIAVRNMLANKVSGSILHISSICAHTGYKGLSMYAATKGALEAFSINTAREWGAKGIRSNCVVAGFMETDMSASLSPEQKERIYGRAALKQATDLNSVAKTCEFLFSEGARSITGKSYAVDAGAL